MNYEVFKDQLTSKEELKEFDRRYFTLRNGYSLFVC